MNEYVTVSGLLVRETGKARCVRLSDGGQEVWIPRSVVNHASINRSTSPPTCILEVQDWWVRKNFVGVTGSL